MAKIDAVIAESKAGHAHYEKYNRQRTIVDDKQKELEFKLGRTVVSFKCDWERARVFIGGTELTQAEAISLAKGLLERLK